MTPRITRLRAGLLIGCAAFLTVLVVWGGALLKPSASEEATRKPQAESSSSLAGLAGRWVVDPAESARRAGRTSSVPTSEAERELLDVGLDVALQINSDGSWASVDSSGVVHAQAGSVRFRPAPSHSGRTGELAFEIARTDDKGRAEMTFLEVESAGCVLATGTLYAYRRDGTPGDRAQSTTASDLSAADDVTGTWKLDASVSSPAAVKKKVAGMVPIGGLTIELFGDGNYRLRAIRWGVDHEETGTWSRRGRDIVLKAAMKDGTSVRNAERNEDVLVRAGTSFNYTSGGSTLEIILRRDEAPKDGAKK